MLIKGIFKLRPSRIVTHLLHLVEQQWDVVDALGDNRLDILHTQA